MLDGLDGVQKRGNEGLKKGIFNCRHAFFGGQNFLFQHFEFGRNVAFSVGEGLFANPILRYFDVFILRRDFQKVAENGIKTDFEA